MRRLVVLALLGGLAACGGAKPPPGGFWNPYATPGQRPRDENYHGGSAAVLQRYDTNKDGALTRVELIAAVRAEFAAHDTRHNGCLSDDEVARINQQRVDQDQTTATPLIDWNHDNCLDYSEFSAFAYSLFDQMDRNRDARITPQEFHPGTRPQGQGQLPGEPRGPRSGPPVQDAPPQDGGTPPAPDGQPPPGGP